MGNDYNLKDVNAGQANVWKLLFLTITPTTIVIILFVVFITYKMRPPMTRETSQRMAAMEGMQKDLAHQLDDVKEQLNESEAAKREAEEKAAKYQDELHKMTLEAISLREELLGYKGEAQTRPVAERREPDPVEPDRQDAIIDTWDGFRGIKWGENLVERNDMVWIVKPGTPTDIGTMRRRGDNMQIGEAELKAITYVTYNDNFSGVGFELEGERNFNRLKRVVEARYGEINQPNPFMEKYEKRGITSQGEAVLLSMELKPFTNEGFLGLFYMPLVRARQDDIDKTAEAAVDDF